MWDVIRVIFPLHKYLEIPYDDQTYGIEDAESHNVIGLNVVVSDG